MKPTRLARRGLVTTAAKPIGLRAKLLIVFGPPLLVLLGLVVFLLTRPPNLEKEATNLAQAALAGDTGTLFSHEFEEERSAEGFDRAKFDRFWNELVAPRLAGFHIVGTPQTQLLAAGDEGVSWVKVADSDGHTYEIATAAWQTDTGVHFLATNYLFTGWVLEKLVKEGKRPSLVNILQAKLEGMRADRAKLDALGVGVAVGMNLNEGKFDTASWDHYEVSFANAIQTLQAQGKEDFQDPGNNPR